MSEPQKETPVADVRRTDMNEEMQALATATFEAARAENENPNDIATYIKKVFDEKYPESWHVIVGKNYGCHVTPEKEHYMFFYFDGYAVVLFKSG
jgi:dynein light chain LC8-type